MDKKNDVLPFSQHVLNSHNHERRNNNVGGVLSYGDDNYGVISEDKHADLEQLQNEVSQMRGIMNQMRMSQDTGGAITSNQAVMPNSIDNNDND